MEILFNIILVVHFVGLALILGAWLVGMKSKTLNPAVWHGALTQLVTGLLLVGLREGPLPPASGQVNHAKVGVKLLVALVITVLAFKNRKTDTPSDGVRQTIGGLALTNVLVAVLWS